MHRMVTLLETFRLKEFPVGVDIPHERVFEFINSLFLLNGVIDDGILGLIKLIRKDRTKSNKVFEECSIYFYHKIIERLAFVEIQMLKSLRNVFDLFFVPTLLLLLFLLSPYQLFSRLESLLIT